MTNVPAPVRNRTRRPAASAAVSPTAEPAAAGRPASPPSAASILHDNLRLHIQYVPPGELTAPRRELRKHSKKQIAQLRASISEFGFLRPLIVDAERAIVAGHGTWLAAKELGVAQVPIIAVEHLSAEQLRLYAIADNQLTTLSSWDDDALRVELTELSALSLDLSLEPLNLELTGFTTSQIDDLIVPPKAAEGEQEDPIPEVKAVAVTKPGDVWQLGHHRLICGNALDPATYELLLQGEKAQMIFADPPYNVPIAGHVSGLGKVQHREFAMASGDMTPPEFTRFLGDVFGHLVANSIDGAIHFQCMDWRHMQEMLAAGHAVYDELKNLIVWTKTNAGMGTFYRSQHELIFAWKVGTTPHINNFGLGETGRWRSNVWTYAGCNAFKRGRDAELAMHSTVKPLSLVSDAIRDCSKRGGLILDPFGGSGITLIAAEKTGRRARLIEIDPLYCDVIVRRWQAETGRQAVLEATGETFDAVAANGAAAVVEGA
jgi:DNA modification methylase